MTLATSVGAANAMLDGFEAYMVVGASQATLTIYQTNTALCVFNLGASSTGTPFGTATGRSLSLSSTLSAPVSNTGTAVAGTANRFVIVGQTSGATALSGTISAVGGGGDLETPSLTVTAAATQSLNALVLRVASDGQLSLEGSLTLV
jgi:hypothetical protein